jgi:predicted secreted protein
MQRLAIMTGTLLCIVFVAGLARAEVTVMRPHDNGKEIRVQAGEVIELALEMQAGTGYLWEFQRLDGKHFELVQSETKPLADQPRVRGPMLQVWRLKTKAPGEVKLSLDYLRP